MRRKNPDSGEEVALIHLNNAPPLLVMAEDVMETVKKRLRDGWIKAVASVEVLAVSKEACESSLKKHIEQMKNEPDSIIYKEKYDEPVKTPSPFRNIKEAYSQVVEIEFISRRYENLVYLVLNYAPSSIEILEPQKIGLSLGEAQGLLNSLSELVHNIVAAKKGGVLIDA